MLIILVEKNLIPSEYENFISVFRYFYRFLIRADVPRSQSKCRRMLDKSSLFSPLQACSFIDQIDLAIRSHIYTPTCTNADRIS